MPVPLTYPGVYIEEIPSGVRPIAGVATSIAAFIGWAPKGPTDSAQLVLSWLDYERKFGGLEVSDAKRLKALEQENARLKKLLAEALLAQAVTQEVLRKKWYAHRLVGRWCAGCVAAV